MLNQVGFPGIQSFFNPGGCYYYKGEFSRVGSANDSVRSFSDVCRVSQHMIIQNALSSAKPVEVLSRVSQQDLSYQVHIDTMQDMEHLFKMTPFYWSTPTEKQNQILAIDEIDMDISFSIEMFQKEG